jgi:hypothetical protein
MAAATGTLSSLQLNSQRSTVQRAARWFRFKDGEFMSCNSYVGSLVTDAVVVVVVVVVVAEERIEIINILSKSNGQ